MVTGVGFSRASENDNQPSFYTITVGKVKPLKNAQIRFYYSSVAAFLGEMGWRCEVRIASLNLY